MNAPARIDWDQVGRIGLYPVGMAAKLISESPGKVRSWIDGNPHSNAPPIICRQLPSINGRVVLGFLDLIEARFVRHFDRLGLSPQSIRKVAEKLRARMNTDHPFATSNRFRTDGKSIIMETMTEEERRHLNLMNDNFEMGDIIEASLFESVLYADDLAYRWRPVHNLSRIILDPKFAFGRPVVDGAWVPTEVLYDAFEAEGSVAGVASDFEMDCEGIEQAIAFEEKLRSGALVEDSAG
jgi:uncharacterized protein (DUF433 family)